MKKYVFVGFFAALVCGIFYAGLFVGRSYGQYETYQNFAKELTRQPLGPETVGFKPLQELPILKQIEIKIEGENRKFLVGEIKSFEVVRYGPKGKSELVFNASGTAVGQIIRATEMNKTIGFTKPDDCYRSRTCNGMDRMAVYTSADRNLEYVKNQDLRREMEYIEIHGLRR